METFSLLQSVKRELSPGPEDCTLHAGESRTRCTINVTQQYAEQPHFLSFLFFSHPLPTPPDGALTKAKFDNSCCSFSLSLSLFCPFSLFLSVSLLFQQLPNVFHADMIFLPVHRINASTSQRYRVSVILRRRRDGTGI